MTDYYYEEGDDFVVQYVPDYDDGWVLTDIIDNLDHLEDNNS